jgi:hypothetical protein
MVINAKRHETRAICIAVFSGFASELKSGTAQSSCGCSDLACVP